MKAGRVTTSPVTPPLPPGRSSCQLPGETGSKVEWMSASDTKVTIRSATTPNEDVQRGNITLCPRGATRSRDDESGNGHPPDKSSCLPP